MNRCCSTCKLYCVSCNLDFISGNEEMPWNPSQNYCSRYKEKRNNDGIKQLNNILHDDTLEDLKQKINELVKAVNEINKE